MYSLLPVEGVANDPVYVNGVAGPFAVVPRVKDLRGHRVRNFNAGIEKFRLSVYPPQVTFTIVWVVVVLRILAILFASNSLLP